jgi:hypothetical protein
MEQMLEQLTPVHGEQGRRRAASGKESWDPFEGSRTDSLALPIAELTSAVRSLTKWKQDEQDARRRVTDELPRLVREEFTAPMNALNDSIHDLTTFLKEAHIHPAQATTTLDELMTRLTDRLAEQHTSPSTAHPERRPFWPKRSLVSARRPTA